MEFKKENYVTNLEDNKIATMSLEDLQRAVEHSVKTAKMNNKCPCEIPVYFTNERTGKLSMVNPYSGYGLAFGSEMRIQLEVSDYYDITYVAPDSRPEEGEYWRSRGIGGSDKNPECSGFVVSKLAGERLRRMVRLVLEKDETESWLDFRETEPNWIQFKFQGSEFDLEKLNELVRENNEIITLDILKQCKK